MNTGLELRVSSFGLRGDGAVGDEGFAGGFLEEDLVGA